MTVIQSPGGINVARGTVRWKQFDDDRVYRCEVVVVRESDGFSVFSTDLPGATSQGETVDEAIANITEALEGLLAEYVSAGRIPWKPVNIEGEIVAKRWISVHV